MFHIAILYFVEIILTVMIGLYLSGTVFVQYKWFNTLMSILKVVTLIMFIYVLLYENLDYAYRVNWFLLFAISPTFGGLIYLLCAAKRPLPKKWRKQYRKTKSYKNGSVFNHSLNIKNDNVATLTLSSPNGAKLSSYVTGCVHTTLNNATDNLKFYPSGEEVWKDILESLNNAKKYIYIEFYIISEGTLWKKVEDIITKKAREGVEIKILYDDMGAIGRLKTKTIKKLNALGIQTGSFNKIKMHLDYYLNFRNHRKLVIIDGNTAFTGGINLADEYINVNSPYGHWYDTGIRFDGEQTEDALKIFSLDWEFATKKHLEIPERIVKDTHKIPGFTQLYLASPFEESPVTRNVFLTMLNNAKDKFYVATPYLALDKTTLEALCVASRSGIDVRIAVPGIPDKKIVYIITRGYFNTLLESGVKIYTYTPGFLHAKLLYADDEIASVGSANIDYRSFYINFESGILLYKTDSLRDINNAFLSLFNESEEQHYKRETLWFKIKHMFVRFLIPLC